MGNTLGKLKKIFKIIKSSNSSDKYENISYSQEGEDRVLERFLENKKSGFYVDIGAHHPKRFSNTYLFYKKGWRGINVDALPESKINFDKERPNDINLELGVSLKEGELTYFMFNEPALNTFNEDEAKKKDGIHNEEYYIIDKRTIKTYALSNILEKYLPKDQLITFLSIDVEGLDLDVLKSNDWKKYRPEIILVEELRTSIAQIIELSEIYKYLNSLGYSLYARTYNTSFYKVNE